MDIINIIFLLAGIFTIIWVSYGFQRMYPYKSKYTKLYYEGIFVSCLSGIIWIVGAVTGYFGLLFVILILNLLFRFYIKMKYPKHEITDPRIISSRAYKFSIIATKIRNIWLYLVFAMIIVAFILNNINHLI